MNRSESIGVLTPKSFEHNLSHQHSLTLDWFRLQPIACIPMVKTDKFNVNISNLLEAAPLSTKVFGQAYLDIHAFFVPKRILWDDWENYRYGNSRSNDDSFVLPHLSVNELSERVGSPRVMYSAESTPNVYLQEAKPTQTDSRRVFGGIGYPTTSIVNDSSAVSGVNYTSEFGDMLISAMQARAYQRIWWDWYRDSVRIEEKNKSSYLRTSGGKITLVERTSLFTPRYRCWRKDYITTLLDSPQLGNASSANIFTSFDESLTAISSGNNAVLDGTSIYKSTYTSPATSGYKLLSSVSVAAMRAAVAAQRFAEKLNVTGTRPIERIQSLFGAKTSPVRLDMSELVGTHRQRVNISGLVNTGSSASLENAPLSTNPFGINEPATSFGQTTGRGYSEGNTPSFNYTAEEDGYFMVIASLIPEFSNPCALNRQFTRGLSTPDASRDDFYTHEFDGLDYQECQDYEIATPEYTMANEGLWGVEYDPHHVTGYHPRYEDYRYIQDRVSGDFNEKGSSTSLRQMLYIRNFQDGNTVGQLPNGLELTTPDDSNRAEFDNHFQITDSGMDHFIFNTYINVKAFRPISKAELPTALSDLANSDLTSVANGGVRL